MTPEQLELLRDQILVYGTICNKLVEMHKAHVLQLNNKNELAPAAAAAATRTRTIAKSSKLKSPPAAAPEASPEASSSPGQRRNRWKANQQQLAVLEESLKEGDCPNKELIREITGELLLYGPVTERNVYNWFHNRKAAHRRRKSNQQRAKASALL